VKRLGPEILASSQLSFIQQGIANGHKKKELQKIWNEIIKFSPQTFMKSYAVGQAWTYYQLIYYDIHLYLEPI
jgi:DNA polymerase III alpha subunit